MSLKEKELITGIQQGDKSTFDFLFRSYYSGLCTFACSYIKKPDAAGEIVQDVFVRMWEKHEMIHVHTSLKAYLYQSVFNGCMNHLKEVQSSGFRHVDIEDASIRNELMTMELTGPGFSDIFGEEVEEDLETAITGLPDQCREIFYLCRIENLSYREIAERLKVSVSTVKTQMSRAMNRILKQMEKYF
jgi:RNA polymerase sigma-70 factor (ECF subfamily)